MSDRVLGALMLALAVALIAGAWSIETGPMMDPLGPRTFPIIIGTILGLGALYPLFRPDPEPDWPGARRIAEIALAVVVMIAYALLLEPAGFLIATALAVFVLSWRLGGTPAHAVLIGVGVAIVLYTVFHLILGLSLPKGPLAF